MMKDLILSILLLIFTVKGFAQTPFITNFPPDVYKAATQNWAVVQDKRGVLFFGNGNGVLEYDGITWRLIKTPSLVRSLAMDSTGRIYIGIRGDLGYLQPDSLGIFQYKSLKEKIESQDREFNDIWKISVSGNRIFFQSGEKIFILQNEKFKVVYPKESFHLSFLVNNTFYVCEQVNGLMIYENDSLQLVKGSDRLSNKKIYEILPYKQNEMLIVTRTQGIWINTPHENKYYKPAGFEAVDKFLLQHHVYCGTILKNGSFAIGTITGGIIVFNPQGEIQTIYNTETGLQDNTVLNLFSDKHQQLWACTNNGISLVQNNLPFQRFNEKNGLNGLPMCVDYFNNHLYVGTSQYLYVQNPNGSFETITGTESQNWQLYQIKGTLLLANNTGLFEIKEKQAFPVITNTGFYNMCPLNNNPDNLLAGSFTGLFLLEYNQKTWKIKNSIKGFTKLALKIVQDKEGCIWVYTNSELYRLRLNETLDSVISVMQCTARQGLPTENATPYRFNSGEVFGTEKGVYRNLSATQTFEVHPDLNMLTGQIQIFQQQKNGDIWFQEKTGDGIYETGILKYSNGTYQFIKQPFYKFTDYAIDGYYNFYAYSDSAVFIGTVKGLLQYNPIQKVDYNILYHTLIRNVFAKDSLLFGGATANLSEFENINGNVIPFSQNNLLFHYAATFYEDMERNLYSYRLIGSDTTWSAWVNYVKKEYTNLDEGEYTFEVKAKNQYKVIGSTASYSFRILPPWQRTWWAYTLYVLFFIGLVFIIVKIYTRGLVAQKEHLEQVVKERTHEIMEKNEELQQQQKELTKLNADKDRFITILAHDLKSPFNSILGFLGLLTENIREYDIDNIENQVNIVNNSAKSTFNLLEDILMWVRASSGKIPYEPQKLNLTTVYNEVIENLKLTANTKEIKINYFSSGEITVLADKNMINTILRNLVSNSIKFTNKKGQIDIYAEKTNTNVIITISDNGIGIEPETLNKLFDISQKISTKGTENEKGTGLGLLLCREFVEKNGGKIWVESEFGKGSDFKFTMPLCND